MARCRFCGSQNLSWKDLNSPPPATVAPPGSTVDQIIAHNTAEQLRLTRSATVMPPKWQLTERNGDRHSCPLSIAYYSRSTSMERRSVIDNWLEAHPQGTINVNDVLPVPVPVAAPMTVVDLGQGMTLPSSLTLPRDSILQFPVDPEGQRLLSPAEITQIQSLTDTTRTNALTSYWAGEWAPDVIYNTDDIVLYNACFYRAKIKVITQRPGNTVYWEKPNNKQMCGIIKVLGKGEMETTSKPELELGKRSIKL